MVSTAKKTFVHKACPQCKTNYTVKTAITLEHLFGPNPKCGSADGLNFICNPCRQGPVSPREFNKKHLNDYYGVQRR